MAKINKTNSEPNFRLYLAEQFADKQIELTNMKLDCLIQNDSNGTFMYNAMIGGFKEATSIYREVLLAELIYLDLIKCEADELIINYPII
jgi:hypothetical protein